MIDVDVLKETVRKDGLVSGGTHLNNHAIFFEDEVEVNTAEGLKAYKTFEFVKITVHGGDNVIHKITNANRKKFTEQLYPIQYKAFKEGKKGEEQMVGGTPIETLTKDAAIIKTLKANFIYSLEQFVSANDQVFKIIPNGYDLQLKAKSILNSEVNNSTIEELKKEIEALKASQSAQKTEDKKTSKTKE
jgi:hypothetical protein